MHRTTIRVLTTVALAVFAEAAFAQRPAYFDDFDYARVGTGQDGRGTLLGANDWLTSRGKRAMRGWRLGFDDDTRREPPTQYFGGPASLAVEEVDGVDALRITMDRGFTFDPARYTFPPLVHTAQVFPPHGTFAARVRFSTLEERQRMIEAFWLFAADQYRFCPLSQPACDVRTPPDGTLQYADEMDFEYNNWFLAETTPHIHSTAIRYREAGVEADDGADSRALSCTAGGVVDRLCVRAGRSLIPGSWHLLVFRVDSARGTVRFDVVEDEAGRSASSRIRAVTESGGPAIVSRTRGMRRTQLPMVHRSPVAMYLSIHYLGREPRGPAPACGQRGGLDATCTQHALVTDWVYHSDDLLAPEEVSAEVARWRRRGEPRVNTLDVPPVTVDPPHTNGGGSSRLELELHGPRRTSRQSTWTVRPVSVREIIYRMDVRIETTCGSRSATCRPRTFRPRAHSFTITPAPGETGMVVRASLYDPWWGYTQVNSPGSDWREWRVDFL